ncbi:hypothetical protein SLA2020_347290, partial [Shorea laevis]
MLTITGVAVEEVGGIAVGGRPESFVEQRLACA